MANTLRNLIEKSKNKSVDSDSTIVTDSNAMIPFEFNGSSYSLAIKEDVLIFDKDDVLISTISPDDLAVAESDFLKTVSEIVAANTNQRIVLFVNKSRGVEKLTFSSLFDATYIFRKLVRVAGRSSEGIESIVVEKNSKAVRKYTNSKARFMKSLGREDTAELENRSARDEDKTELLAILARIEDGMDDIINDNVSTEGVHYDGEKVQKCIDLLHSLQEKYGADA